MRLGGLVTCVIFYLFFPANIIGLWWAVGSPLVMDPNKICKKSRTVGGKQRKICLREPEIVREIAHGAQMAIVECQNQFRNRRWNCHTTQRGIAKVLKLDTKETGYVNAITAAGVVYAVTTACTMGLLLHCTCDHSVRDLETDGHWEWSGCGDDVTFGYKKSRDFMDCRKCKKKSDIRTKLHWHNNEAGRLSVKNYMRRVCKCHGLSGSCALRTCWLKMPIFRHVGQRLLQKYDSSATKVTISNDGLKLIPAWNNGQAYVEEDLVYSSESPDYCTPNRRVGSLGTSGRVCDVTSGGVDGCDLMCCQRGYQETKVMVHNNCQCTFHWCCRVECKTCVTEQTIARCN